VVIERVPNPFAVFWDPAAREPSRADARYCFIADEIPVETFKEMYPNATVVDATTEHQPITFVQSGSQDVVVVLEYFNVEHDEYDIWLAPDGSTLREKDFPPDLPPDLLDAAKAQMKTRRVRKPKVVWRKISAKDVLEGPVEMPCEQIPVFAVTGEEIHLGERVYRSSVIRHAKDAAFLYDLARSTEAEITMLQPRAPFLVTPMQVQNLEGFWADANRANRPYLLYNPDPKAPGAPQRVAPPVPSSALQNEIMLAAEDKKRTTGIYDAALGARSNETSGVAINARKQEAAAATSIYADNMVKAVTQCGRVITQMIPKIYDTQRVIRILGADHQEKAVVINQTLEGVDGAVVMNDVTRGAYSVRVSVGPAYQTMRQEAAESQMQFLREVPQAQALVADIVAANQDWPGADRIAERLRKALPPGIEEDDTQQPNPQQAQQMQMQQMMQSMQMRKAEAETREAEAQAAQAEAKAIEAQQSAKKAQAEATEAELKVRAIMAGMAASPLQPPVSGF
jgi:hypothetical protein